MQASQWTLNPSTDPISGTPQPSQTVPEMKGTFTQQSAQSPWSLSTSAPQATHRGGYSRRTAV